MQRIHAAVVCSLLVLPLLVAAAGCSSHSADGLATDSVSPPGATLQTIPEYPTSPVCSAPTRAGQARCLSHVRTDAAGKPLALGPAGGFGPVEIASAYNLPAGGGAGTVVALVDAYDDPNAESDLAVYRAHFGLPPCTTANGCFQKVNQNGVRGSYPGTDPASEWPLETALDLDAVSSACPSCKILLVESNTDDLSDLGAAVNSAARLGASAISNSYGGSEDSSNAQTSLSYYNHPGILVTASSGDGGYGTLYPASSQYVLGVGGTKLVTASNARGWTETAWTSGGSGCSQFTPKPSWQKDKGCGFKTVADISAVADPNTGLSVYNTANGAAGWMVIGGTSLASPIIASIFARMGETGAGPSFPYAHPTWFNDVTSGTNGSCGGSYLCTAGAGYDGPTGMGTPNGGAWTGGVVVDGGAPDSGPPVVIDAGAPEAPPQIALVSPANGATLPGNTQLSLVADVTSAVGIASVVLDWQQSSGTVQVDCAAPPAGTTCTHTAAGAYTFSFTPTTGSRSWSIVATDTAGASTTSATRSLTLGASNTPSVTFDSPSAGGVYARGSVVPIRVEATGPSGVSQVWLTWVAPSSTSQLQLTFLGGTQWGVDVPVIATAVHAARTLTVTAYDPSNVTGSATTTIEIP